MTFFSNTKGGQRTTWFNKILSSTYLDSVGGEGDFSGNKMCFNDNHIEYDFRMGWGTFLCAEGDIDIYLQVYRGFVSVPNKAISTKQY